MCSDGGHLSYQNRRKASQDSARSSRLIRNHSKSRQQRWRTSSLRQLLEAIMTAVGIFKNELKGGKPSVKPSRITALVSTFEGSGEMEGERGGREKKERGGSEGFNSVTTQGVGEQVTHRSEVEQRRQGEEEECCSQNRHLHNIWTSRHSKRIPFCRASLLAGFMLAPPHDSPPSWIITCL